MASNNRNKNKWWFYPKVLKTKKSHPLNLIRLLQMIFIVPYISSLYPFNFRLSNAFVRRPLLFTDSHACPTISDDPSVMVTRWGITWDRLGGWLYLGTNLRSYWTTVKSSFLRNFFTLAETDMSRMGQDVCTCSWMVTSRFWTAVILHTHGAYPK